jgi:tetratricopeptide (TPR) repeat protein
MSTSKCPECGKPATGNFCQNCGSKLGGRFCNQCGAELGGGAKFCNQCGEKQAGGARPARAPAHREAAVSVVGGQNLPWWIAGVAMFGLIVFVGVQAVTPGARGAPAATQPQPVAPFASGGGNPPDLSQMTPREAADRLFDRVMRDVSAGDSAQAQAFLPMALGAYERAMPLDNDGLFHLSLLNRVAGNLDAALANAQQILAEDPNHILGLVAAAEATAEMGRVDEARGYYQHILDVIDSETARALPEYEAHEVIMESARSDAEAFLAAH